MNSLSEVTYHGGGHGHHHHHQGHHSEHEHEHHNGHSHGPNNRKGLTTALLFTASILVLEFVGGLLIHNVGSIDKAGGEI